MDPIDFMQKFLRILFYVLVIAALAGYAAEYFFNYPNTYWIWSGMGAVGCSVIRFFLRFV